MIRSMTGFGKAECEAGSRKVSLEIRCLNSKQLDLFIRVPSVFREFEGDIRSEVSRRLTRGKIEVIISQEAAEGDGFYQLNASLAKKYFADIQSLAKELQLELGPNLLNSLLQLPDVFKSGKELLAEEEWQLINEAMTQALDQVDSFRINEGKSIEEDLMKRVHLILQYLKEVARYEGPRIDLIRQRMLKSLQDQLQGTLPDQNRFEQEMIYYLERLDVTEEKVRLDKHCSHFFETLQQDDPPGKKLGFIAQEMGREINTLGSKANDSDIQRLVVLMKDELEKVKEQLFNVL